MQLLTKKYGGDPIRTYKALMRKLSREGHYQDVKEKEYFKSKAQKKREASERGRIRVQKKLRIIQENIAKELAIKKFRKTISRTKNS